MNDDQFLAAVRAYIEEIEVKDDAEWGTLRTLDQLIAAGEMPDVYAEVLKRQQERSA